MRSPARALPALVSALLAGCPSASDTAESSTASESTEGTSSGAETSQAETEEPQAGSETGSEAPSECDNVARNDCYDEAAALTLDCRALCGSPYPSESCESGACHWQCEAEHQVARIACDEATSCEPAYWPWYSECMAEVYAEALACSVDACDPLECTYDTFWAATACACSLPDFRIPFTGSCSFVFDQPEVYNYAPWAEFEVGPGFGQSFSIGNLAFGLRCADTDEEAVANFVDPTLVITLCDELCEVFAESGEMTMNYGIPCE